jgi:O-antigen ligase
VSESLGWRNEAYTVPKAFVLSLCAAGAALILARRIPELNGSWFDCGLLVIATHAVASAWLLSPTWATAALALQPELCAALMLLLVSSHVGGAAERASNVVVITVVATSVMAGLALCEAGGLALPWQGLRRPHSTLGNRNFVGGECSVVLCLAVAHAVRAPRLGPLASVTILTTAVVVTRCRSAWLGAILGLSVLAAAGLLRSRQQPASSRPNRGALAASAALLTGLGIAILLPWPGLHWNEGSLASTFQRIAEYDSGTGRERLNDLELAAHIAWESPWFGVGPRGWDDAASARAHLIPTLHASPRFSKVTPNSDLARLLAERGVVGIGLVVALLSALLVRLCKKVRQGTGAQSSPASLLAALIAFAVHASLDAPLFRISSLFLCATLLGLARPVPVRARRSLLQPFSPRRRAMVRAVSTCVGALLAVTVLTTGTLRTLAAHTIAAGAASAQSLSRAQRLFPRPDVGEMLAHVLALQGDCAAAEAVWSDAARISPHHWGGSHVVMRCWEKAGRPQAAERWRRHRDAIEPHVEQLIATRR